MIQGDEGKPVTFFELITDEPRDVEPFLEYTIRNWIAYRDGVWPSENWDEPCKCGSVTINISKFIHQLEDALFKLRRERAEASK